MTDDARERSEAGAAFGDGRDLRVRLPAVPERPGVYRFLDDGGRALYVGKAKELRKRVSSYFRGPGGAPPGRIGEMVRRAADLEWVVTGNEVEALLLEDNFIKEARPPYNVRLRDDKSYPFIEITVRDEWPRVRFMRGDRRPGNLYFGPYSSARKVRETLELIGRIFPFRKCRGEQPGRRSGSPCLQYFIKRSLAPCDGRCTHAEYMEVIDQVVAFLRGRMGEVRRRIEQDMKAAAGTQEFEKAALLRDRLDAVRHVEERQVARVSDEGAFDVVALYQGCPVAGSEGGPAATVDPTGATVPGEVATGGSGEDGAAVAGGPEVPAPAQSRTAAGGAEAPAPAQSRTAASGGANMQVFRLREGALVDRQTFFVENVTQRDRVEVLEELLLDFYWEGSGVPPEVIVDADGDLSSLEAALCRRRGAKVRVHRAQRGPKRRLLELARQNAELAAEAERQRATGGRRAREEALQRLREVLDLPGLPLRIECYDISNLGEADAVGSMVVFESGRPKKAHYRTFAIRDMTGQDDFAMMRQVVARRLSRVSADGAGGDCDESFATLPDLLLVDGGKGQLAAALAGVREAGIEVPVAALAKQREEVFVPGRGAPLPLSTDDPGSLLLQRVRDEAHRVAVGFHRRRRSTGAHASVLDGISGVGPVRRRRIVEHFGSPERVLAADREELEAVPGLPRKVAREIHEQLHRIR